MGSLRVLWGMSREDMLQVYNSIEGVRPVSRFTDATTAKTRVIRALDERGLKLARVSGQPGKWRIVPVHLATDLSRGNSLLKTIHILSRDEEGRIVNPKTGASLDRFNLYREGMTMLEYIDAAMATGIKRYHARRDIYHDCAKGYIEVRE